MSHSGSLAYQAALLRVALAALRKVLEIAVTWWGYKEYCQYAQGYAQAAKAWAPLVSDIFKGFFSRPFQEGLSVNSEEVVTLFNWVGDMLQSHTRMDAIYADEMAKITVSGQRKLCNELLDSCLRIYEASLANSLFCHVSTFPASLTQPCR